MVRAQSIPGGHGWIGPVWLARPVGFRVPAGGAGYNGSMATKLTVGDVVRLNVPVKPVEYTDEDKKSHFVAEQMSETEAKGVSLPHSLFGSVTGIYLGHTRLKLRDNRATRGVVRRYFHRFMFGTKEAMIEHHHVDVFISYADLLKASEEED